jgi:hypothetical protein
MSFDEMAIEVDRRKICFDNGFDYRSIINFVQHVKIVPKKYMHNNMYLRFHYKNENLGHEKVNMTPYRVKPEDDLIYMGYDEKAKTLYLVLDGINI